MTKQISLIFNKQYFLVAFTVLAVAWNTSAQDKAANPETKQYPQVSIPNTEVRTFFSKILNQDMEISIKLPAGYYTSPQKTYQALYMTDANYAFPMAANFLSLYEAPRPVEPGVCLIGIGYKINNMREWYGWRTRDLTPPVSPSRATGTQPGEEIGGAPKFLEFIVKELFPFVESQYRVSASGRGLGGYSYGGLFSLYVLFKQPDLFSLYVAGSPSIDFGDGILFEYETEYASSHKDLSAQLFMSAGGDESIGMISNMKKMAGVLESGKYPGLKIQTHVFPGESHTSGCAVSIMRAIKALYKDRKEIKLSTEILARYAGVYEMQPGMDMTITLEGNQLFATVTGYSKVPLFAETETKFFLKAIDYQYEFIRDSKGIVTHAILLPEKMKAHKK
jgi:predicted alpha/beta superfamily hydrolase